MTASFPSPTEKTKTLRAVSYCRVSRRDQRPELQVEETRQLIERRGWTLVEIFLDHGVSGAKDRRPALDRLLAAAKRREFDVLCVYRSDRLFRSLKHMVTCLDELSSLGIGFVSVSEPFDSCTPSGRLMVQLVGAFAEFERQVLIERTHSGLEAARRRGAKIGRPRAEVDVQRALKLRAEGKSLRQIACALEVGVATVSRALQSASASGVPKPVDASEVAA